MCAAERNARYVSNFFASHASVVIFSALCSTTGLIRTIQHVKNDPSIGLVLGVDTGKSRVSKNITCEINVP